MMTGLYLRADVVSGDMLSFLQISKFVYLENMNLMLSTSGGVMVSDFDVTKRNILTFHLVGQVMSMTYLHMRVLRFALRLYLLVYMNGRCSLMMLQCQ